MSPRLAGPRDHRQMPPPPRDCFNRAGGRRQSLAKVALGSLFLPRCRKACPRPGAGPLQFSTENQRAKLGWGTLLPAPVMAMETRWHSNAGLAKLSWALDHQNRLPGPNIQPDALTSVQTSSLIKRDYWSKGGTGRQHPPLPRMIALGGERLRHPATAAIGRSDARRRLPTQCQQPWPDPPTDDLGRTPCMHRPASHSCARGSLRAARREKHPHKGPTLGKEWGASGRSRNPDRRSQMKGQLGRHSWRGRNRPPQDPPPPSRRRKDTANRRRPSNDSPKPLLALVAQRGCEEGCKWQQTKDSEPPQRPVLAARLRVAISLQGPNVALWERCRGKDAHGIHFSLFLSRPPSAQSSCSIRAAHDGRKRLHFAL